MLYVVGGCSQSGKSILAERMRVPHGGPWFTLDALKMGLYLGAPELEVLPAADDFTTADQMWPVIEPILDHALDQAVRACFLGYPGIDIEEKAAAVADHTGPPFDWLHRTGVDNVYRYLSVSQELSRQLRNDCGARYSVCGYRS